MKNPSKQAVKRALRRLFTAILAFFDIIPSMTVILNPLLFVMFFPLGVYAVLTWPWTFLKDVPDPFHPGESLYWLTYMIRTDDNILLPSLHRWGILDTALLIAGSAIFLSAFATWLMNLKKGLITSGIYSVSRHPQYLGLILATLGVSIRSLRPMSLIAWLTLTLGYLILASLEERDLLEAQAETYERYMKEIPFMLPLVKINVPSSLSPRYLYRYLFLLAFYVLSVSIIMITLKSLATALRSVFSQSQVLLFIF